MLTVELFQKLFQNGLSSKFVIKKGSKVPPYVNNIATVNTITQSAPQNLIDKSGTGLTNNASRYMTKNTRK